MRCCERAHLEPIVPATEHLVGASKDWAPKHDYHGAASRILRIVLGMLRVRLWIFALVLTGLAGAVSVVACGDDTAEPSSPGSDAGGAAETSSDDAAPPSPPSPEDASPDVFTPSNRAVQASAGIDFGCATLESRQVWCWGDDSFGQIGAGSVSTTACEAAAGHTCRSATRVAGDFVQVSAGTAHACAVSVDGEVYCWGRNDLGQLGHEVGSRGDAPCTVGSTTRTCNPTPVRVDGIDGVVEVAAGTVHTCARTNAGAVYCWGLNAQPDAGAGGPVPDRLYGGGLLGSGSMTPAISATPVAVAGLSSGVTSLAVSMVGGLTHACAVKNGFVYCWGSNGLGQLGHGRGEAGDLGAGYETALNPTARAVSADGGSASLQATSVLAGDGVSCAENDGSIACWGFDGYGQLGRYTFTYVNPTPVMLTDRPLSSLSIHYTHVCGLSSDDAGAGNVRCWGANDSAQLGPEADGGITCVNSVPCVAEPKVVPIQATHVSAGGFSLAIRTDGTVWAWGANGSGQLGHPAGTEGDVACSTGPCNPVPEQVQGLPPP